MGVILLTLIIASCCNYDRSKPEERRVSPAVVETPSWSLRGESRGLKLALPKSCGRDEPVPFDQPRRVVGLAEREQRLAQILDHVEGLRPTAGSPSGFG